LEEAQRADYRGSTSAAAAAAQEPMDVNDVSDYATVFEDTSTLDEMNVDFRRSVTMEEHWRSSFREHICEQSPRS
jgi:hypothetical protein